MTSSVTPCSTCRRVFISKKKKPLGVDQVLDRADADVVDGPGHGDGRIPHLPADGIGHQHGRRLLDHLLVPALHRALPVEQVQHGAVGVPDHLDLDVAGGLEIALQEDLVRAEGGRRLALRRRHGLDQLAGSSRTRRMPRPPPPADALTSRG